ncbi:5868_t:CDS:2 [Ambispora gerdemannii]|uniref:5868_t:CDS:1 n=1 Tax=Ambispora gerdemannii TaxID=144530 RepID=A0A9N8Z3L4_9GLOM|nr:5868_t:CDS:2 [Ambispora gerdemannii]
MNYEITGDKIRVTLSDGHSFTPRDPTPEGDIVSYFRSVNEASDLEWRNKLGEGLVLLLNEKKGTNIELPKRLSAFPRGYALYEHIKETDKFKRNDKYLFGLGEKRFRSPNEFVPHLYWLATNRERRCQCKICTGAKLTPQLVTVSNIGSSSGNPTEPKPQRPAKGRSVKAPLFRVGEIIWFNICQAADYRLAAFGGLIDLDKSKNNINDMQHITKYWPCVVHRVQKHDIENSDDFEFRYTIKLLALPLNETVSERSLRPWISYQPRMPTSIFANTSSENAIIEASRGTLSEFIQPYEKAISIARRIVQSYCPMKPYFYSESQESNFANDRDKTHLRQMSSFQHYREMYIGAEKVREFDFLRLYPDDAQTSAFAASSSSSKVKDGSSIKKDNYFMISTIFYNPAKGIQFTGDLYEMGRSTIDNPRYIDDFQWIPLNEQYEEYTIDLADVMGRFYVSFPHLNHPMSIQHNRMKTEIERDELLYPDAPPFSSQTEDENFNAEIDRLIMKSLSPKMHEKRSVQNLQLSPSSSKRQKINNSFNIKSMAKESGSKPVDEVVVIDSDSSEEKIDISHTPRKNNTSSRSTQNHSIRSTDLTVTNEDHVNSRENIGWSGKITWPKSPDGRTLLAAPELPLQIPAEMNWEHGIEIRAKSFPLASNRSCDIFEHFPRNLTISAISNLDPFEAYDQTMGDLVHFCLDPDFPFPFINRLHFNALAKTLFSNMMSVVVVFGPLSILLKSDDGTNILGLCSLQRTNNTNTPNHRATITNNPPASNHIRCINKKTQQKAVIDISDVTTLVELFRKISEAFNLSLHDKTPEEIRLRFKDNNQELYLILPTLSSPKQAYGNDDSFGRNPKYTHSLDFVKKHAKILIFEL